MSGQSERCDQREERKKEREEVEKERGGIDAFRNGGILRQRASSMWVSWKWLQLIIFLSYGVTRWRRSVCTCALSITYPLLSLSLHTLYIIPPNTQPAGGHKQASTVDQEHPNHQEEQ